jgi:hypothetical protein
MATVAGAARAAGLGSAGPRGTRIWTARRTPGRHNGSSRSRRGTRRCCRVSCRASSMPHPTPCVWPPSGQRPEADSDRAASAQDRCGWGKTFGLEANRRSRARGGMVSPSLTARNPNSGSRCRSACADRRHPPLGRSSQAGGGRSGGGRRGRREADRALRATTPKGPCRDAGCPGSPKRLGPQRPSACRIPADVTTSNDGIWSRSGGALGLP